MSMRVDDSSSSHPDDDWFAPSGQPAAAYEGPPGDGEPSSEHEPEWEVTEDWEHDDPATRDVTHRHIGVVLAVVLAVFLVLAGFLVGRITEDSTTTVVTITSTVETPAATTGRPTPRQPTPPRPRRHPPTPRQPTRRPPRPAPAVTTPTTTADVGSDRRDAPSRNQGLPVRRNAAGRAHEPRVCGGHRRRKLRPVDRRGRVGLPDGEQPPGGRCRGTCDARGDQHGPREGLTPAGTHRGGACHPAVSCRTSGSGGWSRSAPCPGRGCPMAR